MKTSELIGPALDWAVAKCEGYTDWCSEAEKLLPPRKEHGWVELYHLNYSTDWEQGGPIIEREKISIDFDADPECGGPCAASTRDAPCYWVGPTPLIAAMRTFVASKLGDEIEIPEGL